MSDTLLSRFLRYVQIDTQSDETSKTFPSTSGQLVLLEMLKQELSELGAADVQMTRHGYVLASIPANTRKARVPTVAFLAHVDTAPDCSGKNVKPIVHRKYDGRVMKFPDKPGLTLDPATSPELRTAIGKDIVTASGTTLLGSDDKSGVAVIMTLVERLLRETKRKHGLIRVCFTPDEEIGRGVDKLDLRMLGADVAYTLDGGPPGEICWETFSGDAAEVIIDGITTHTMEAKAKGMVWVRERLGFRPPRPVGRWCQHTRLPAQLASCSRLMSGFFRGCTSAPTRRSRVPRRAVPPSSCRARSG